MKSEHIEVSINYREAESLNDCWTQIHERTMKDAPSTISQHELDQLAESFEALFYAGALATLFLLSKGAPLPIRAADVVNTMEKLCDEVERVRARTRGRIQ